MFDQIRWFQRLLLLWLGLVSTGCVTSAVSRSIEGTDAMGRIDSAWRAPDGAVHVCLSAALGGAYFLGDCTLVISASEVEAVRRAPRDPGQTAVVEQKLARSAARSGVVTSERAREHGFVELPVVRSAKSHSKNPALTDLVPAPGSETTVYDLRGDNILFGHPRLVLALACTIPGTGEQRNAVFTLHGDSSSHALAAWTAPLTLPLALAFDACTWFIMGAGAGG